MTYSEALVDCGHDSCSWLFADAWLLIEAGASVCERSTRIRVAASLLGNN